MKGDSIPVCRSIMEHWIYKDNDYFKAWFEMLARARYSHEPKTDIYEKIVYTLNRGEFIFGRTSWSLRLGISEQKLRTLIKKLQRDNMIKLTSRYAKFSIYSIVNYEKFNQQDNQQADEQQEGTTDSINQQSNQQLTSIQPAANQQLTTKEECKEGKKVKTNIYTLEFESFYKAYPNPQDKQRSFKNWKKQLKTETADRLMQAALNYKKLVETENRERQYIKSSANFLGQENFYQDYLPENFKEPKPGQAKPQQKKNGFDNFTKRSEIDPTYAKKIEEGIRRKQEAEREAMEGSISTDAEIQKIMEDRRKAREDK